MKHTFTLCMLLLCTLLTNAQSYDSALRYRLVSPSFYQAMDHFIQQAATDLVDTSEENVVNVLERRKLWMSSRISNDVPLGEDMFAPMNKALVSYMAYYNDYCPGSGFTGNWSCLGIYKDFYNQKENNGRIDAIWVHPTDTAHILIGANGGGLWKTNNGGRTWRNITDGAMGTASSVLGMAGVQCIAVNPADTNRIYIAQGGREQSKKSYNYGLGLVYTTNGGTTWHTDADFNVLVTAAHVASVTKVAFMPGTQMLFAISEHKVLYKPSPTDSWVNITPPAFSAHSRQCTDMDFTHSPSGRLVVSFSAVNDTSYLATYDPGTDTWVYTPMVLSGGYTQPYSNLGPVRFSLTSSDVAYIQFRVHNGIDTPASLLIRTPINIYSQDIRNAVFTDHLPGHSCYQVMDFMVSPANSDIIYVANYSDPGPVMVSIDGGITFLRTTDNGHYDGNCIFIHSATNTTDGVNDVVFVGNDGGIRKKRYGTTPFAGITGTGLCVTQFFGFGGTEADDNILMAGAQDVGTWAYRKNESEQWLHTRGSDGYTAKFAVNGVKKAFGEYNNPSSPLHRMFGRSFSGSSILDFTVPTPTDSPISNINRPQYFNPQNTAHVGYSYIWKKHFINTTGNWETGNWKRAFQSEPVYYGLSVPYDKRVVDFHINEEDTNVVYIAYRDITYDRAGNILSPLNDTFGKLYYSDDAYDPSSPGWTNITPSICTSNAINTIMVDPQNPARIWVGFGNVNNGYVGANPDTMKRRVWYSYDYGIHWTEASKGLSALPVNKLVYRKGSDDELYAGTDAGVFKWNKTAAQWECFNNGLPPCTVMDMEFNYCAGKLRVATFGRGIWDTPLPILAPTDEKPIVIDTNTIWSTEKWLQSPVVVKTGARLTITGTTIHMPANAHIMVQPGAELVVNSSRITNSCEGCHWGGIQAWGQNWHAQLPTYQAVVQINNSTIEYAVKGVGNYNPADGVVNMEGGIIKVRNSTFRNNITAVHMRPYHNFDYTPYYIDLPDLSNFVNTHFTINNDYKLHPTPINQLRHVQLDGVRGVQFVGCHFTNYHASLRGHYTGIHATNAGFNVTPGCLVIDPYGGGCLTGYDPSSFRGLSKGIHVVGTTFGETYPPVSIESALFDSSGIGVHIDAHTAVSVTRSQFFIGQSMYTPFAEGLSTLGVPQSCGRNVGILTQNALLFKIEGNTFTSRANTFGIAPWHNIGVLAANSGNASNRIYRNTFTQLSYGVLGVGNMSNHHPALSGHGLKVLCNTFNTNTNDIYSGGNLGSHGLGIEQTYPLHLGAGNTFTGSTLNIANPNLFRPLKYYNDYYAGTVSTSGNVTLITASTATCSSTLPTGGGGDITGSPIGPLIRSPLTAISNTDLFIVKSHYFAAKHRRDSVSQYLTTVIDLGNTQALRHFIDTCANADTLFGRLTDISPYLSRTALDRIITKTIQVGTAYYQPLIDVMALNPEVISDYDYLKKTQEDIDMTTNDFDMLWSIASTTISARGEIENEKGAEQATMNANLSDIILALKSPIDTNISLSDTTFEGICLDTASIYYLIDTNSRYIYLDSLDTWLTEMGSKQATHERIGRQLAAGNLQQAAAVYNSLGYDAYNNQPDPTEEQEYSMLWGVLYDAAIQGRSALYLTSTDKAGLTAPEGINIDASAARSSVAHLLYPSPYVLFPCASAPLAARSSSNDHIKHPDSYNTDADKKDKLKAYPNPSDGMVTFQYQPSGMGTDEITITVLNVLGEKVMQQNIEATTTRLQWNAAKLPSGIYLYTGTNSKGAIIGKGKIVLNR